MAYSEFRSAKKLLPALLSKLAKHSGSATGLGPVWAEAAGDVFAKTCSPLRVEGETLVISAPDKSWRARVEEHAVEIGKRLSETTSGQLTRVTAEVPR
jgi:hypothetical protein